MEKNYFTQRKSLFLVLILVFCSGIYAQHYFDAAAVHSDSIRLTVLNPSKSRVSTILSLREKALLDPDKLMVIGVFHEKERTDYREAIQYIKDNEINWIRFHKLTGALTEDMIFQKNVYSSKFEQIFNKSDGIMLFGGADIPPSTYGHATNLLTSISTPYRHYLELSLVFHLLGGSQNKSFTPLLDTSPEFPLIGFCLGAQTINVGTGGTMIQDIWSEKYGVKSVEKVLDLHQDHWHKNPYVKLYPEKKLVYYYLHKINLLKEGKFTSEWGFYEKDTPFILSGHHQMIDTLGKDIRIIATSMDDRVPEAVEHGRYPNVLGVQFHPEYNMLWNADTTFRFTPTDTVKKSLFSMLEKNPPSLNFHKKLWSWFEEKLVEYHRNRVHPLN